MGQTTRRTNPTLIALTRAAVVGSSVFAGLQLADASPAALPIALGLVAAVLSYLVADLGVLVAVACLSLPLLATAPLLGIVFLVLGIAGVRYLGADGGRSFLVVAVGIGGAFLGPGWAAAALAGFLLGAGEGALAAAVACFVAQALGIALGREAIGVLMIGAGTPLLDPAAMPNSLLQLSWFADSLRTLDAGVVDSTVDAVTAVRHPLALVIQPALWAVGAAAAGLIAREGRKRSSLPVTMASLIVGVSVPALGALAASTLLGGPASGLALSGLGTSALLALAVGFAYERFYVTEVAREAQDPRRSAMDAEDADVDELLTLIATAEERLATEHTTVRVVMITDMKSFSRMTEEDGSMLSAKAIQRHRDLLLPIVQRHGGSGKSTGGDGLIAAFESADEALIAAVEMQETLAEHNRTHPSERDLSVRIGIAQGEVVLDKRGRPFIGAAINLAARIMNLADGGQAFAEAAITRSSSVETRALGGFELKNIADTTEVVEVLWSQPDPIAADAG